MSCDTLKRDGEQKLRGEIILWTDCHRSQWLALAVTYFREFLGCPFRDSETKKITKWGKVALWGIFLSTALSFIAQLLESQKSVRDAQETAKRAQEQIERSNEILANINRTLNPLTNVRVTYWISAPLDAPELSAYRKRLLDGVDQILAAPDKKEVRNLGYISAGWVQDPQEVAIPQFSPLMPQRDEVLAYYLLRFSGLRFDFFKTPHREDEYLAACPVTWPDLAFSVDYWEYKKRLRIQANYDLPFSRRRQSSDKFIR